MSNNINLVRFRSFLFWTAFVLHTAILGIIYAPFVVFKPFRHPLYYLHCVPVLYFMKLFCGLEYKVIGQENIPKTPYIVASKHQSMYEAFAFAVIFYFPSFILKRELIKIPVIGWHLYFVRMIYINRGKKHAALKKVVAQAQDRINEKRSIIIFPQGTRVKPYTKAKYQSGIAALYQEYNLPVVPVALNTGLFWPKDQILLYPGKITIKIMPPIEPGLETKELMARLEDIIETESDKLLPPKN